MTLIHINAAESFHQKQQKSTVMTKITFLICTTVYVHIRLQSTHLFLTALLPFQERTRKIAYSFLSF